MNGRLRRHRGDTKLRRDLEAQQEDEQEAPGQLHSSFIIKGQMYAGALTFERFSQRSRSLVRKLHCPSPSRASHRRFKSFAEPVNVEYGRA